MWPYFYELRTELEKITATCLSSNQVRQTHLHFAFHSQKNVAAAKLVENYIWK